MSSRRIAANFFILLTLFISSTTWTSSAIIRGEEPTVGNSGTWRAAAASQSRSYTGLKVEPSLASDGTPAGRALWRSAEPSPSDIRPDAAPLPDRAYEPATAPPATVQPGSAQAGDGCGYVERGERDCGQCGACFFPGNLAGVCPRWLTRVGGWLDQGITGNNRNPRDRFNGPITFNDRSGEYQLNQFYLFAERATCTSGHGWDIGGRVDVSYGTDWRFFHAHGLEDRWNAERFYGIALPQLYADVAYNNLTVRMGRFYAQAGYESVMSQDNFFYSHAYVFQYGEPKTQTGLLATYRLSEVLALSAGFDRGWDNWEDNNNNLEFIARLQWNWPDDRTRVAFALTSGDYDDAGRNNRTFYSILISHQITERLKYVIQHDRGGDNDGGINREDAEWYGINQYFFYELNERLAVGFRVEWFRDDDGTRVGGIGAPHGWTLGPDIPNQRIGWAGSFYEMTLGVNWKPRPNLILRPECRWDWYEGPADGLGRLPYGSGLHANQFTYGFDLLWVF